MDRINNWNFYYLYTSKLVIFLKIKRYISLLIAVFVSVLFVMMSIISKEAGININDHCTSTPISKFFNLEEIEITPDITVYETSGFDLEHSISNKKTPTVFVNHWHLVNCKLNTEQFVNRSPEYFHLDLPPPVML